MLDAILLFECNGNTMIVSHAMFDSSHFTKRKVRIMENIANQKVGVMRSV